jgi:hypothetical protein
VRGGGVIAELRNDIDELTAANEQLKGDLDETQEVNIQGTFSENSGNIQ